MSIGDAPLTHMVRAIFNHSCAFERILYLPLSPLEGTRCTLRYISRKDRAFGTECRALHQRSVCVGAL
ncbi:protein of unknown function [Pararobbsia alpina]